MSSPAQNLQQPSRVDHIGIAFLIASPELATTITSRSYWDRICHHQPKTRNSYHDQILSGLHSSSPAQNLQQLSQADPIGIAFVITSPKLATAIASRSYWDCIRHHQAQNSQQLSRTDHVMIVFFITSPKLATAIASKSYQDRICHHQPSKLLHLSIH